MRLALLGPPVVWISLFLAAYLMAEWVCEVEEPERGRGSDLLVWSVVGATALATVGLAAVARMVWRTTAGSGDGSPSEERREARLLVGLLGGCFGAAILLVALPAIVLGPCR